MANVHVTENEIQKAVDEVLNTNEWPIYKTQDDNGLEESEYFCFARQIIRKLGLIKTE
jgi:hypothetical protein